MRVAYSNTLPAKDEYFRLFESTGWNEGYQLDADGLREAIGKSWYLVSAYHDDHLVGFGRVISDGVLHALIVDLIVLPDYQGSGIGSRILDELTDKCRSQGIPDIQLFCASGKVGFYEKHGFARRPADGPGMELRSPSLGSET